MFKPLIGFSYAYLMLKTNLRSMQKKLKLLICCEPRGAQWLMLWNYLAYSRSCNYFGESCNLRLYLYGIRINMNTPVILINNWARHEV